MSSKGLFFYPTYSTLVVEKEVYVFGLHWGSHSVTSLFCCCTSTSIGIPTKTQYALLTTNDRWFGVIYKEDKASVVESFKKLYEDGVYDRELYGEAFYATLLP